MTYVSVFEVTPLVGLSLHVGRHVLPHASKVDLFSLACSIVNTIPSLEYVGLNVCNQGHQTDSCKISYVWFRRNPEDKLHGSSLQLEQVIEWEGPLIERRLNAIGST